MRGEGMKEGWMREEGGELDHHPAVRRLAVGRWEAGEERVEKGGGPAC